MAEKAIVSAHDLLPGKLLVLPINGKPVFPGILTPMVVQNKQDIEIVEQALGGDGHLGLLLTRSAEENENHQSGIYSKQDFFTVGTAVKIAKKINIPDGGLNIFITTLQRFKVKRFLSTEPMPLAAVDYPEEQQGDPEIVKALTRSLLNEMKEIMENNPFFSEEMRVNMFNIDQPGKLADIFTSVLNIERSEQQKMLEQTNVQKRLEQVLIFVSKEKELLKIQKKVQKQINEKIEKNQRDYFLKEELKAIKGELGMEVDARSSEYNRFREAVEKLTFSGEIKEQIERELEKFSLMENSSSEYIVTRNYLDTIISLPWQELQPESFSLERARKILDKEHYGLDDVKERIIEYLAVRKLRETTRGSIVCLVGPPGVGKTSVGRSIARSLNKKFFRFSVGGMRDEAEIKGHRRTYVGAMPGKIIQGLKVVKSKDPVFMIDEIDKLGSSYQGDPSSALLEVLDPEQNNAFRDHYLDLPFDLSNIFFIVTANSLDTIPRPLLDRMEVIKLSGYIEKEKIEIGRRYLLPRSLERNGLNKSQAKINSGAMSIIVNDYAREAGVRNFEKALDKINRKLAKQLLLQEKEFPISIDKDNIQEYLGKPVFKDRENKKIIAPGMINGLAVTGLGGDTLVIEAIQLPGKNSFEITGQMGKVMQESANIALSYVKHIAPRHRISDEFFNKNSIHLHIPAGATPKDGPSAGIAMASALFSLATGRKVRGDIAMTGELSLVGKVLPIGGLKEKTIAARQHKMKTVLFPEGNLSDLEEIPEYIKKGIEFLPVNNMKQVLERLF